MFFNTLIRVNQISQLPPKNAHRNLIGAILIKLGTGMFATYGNINLYFLSFLKNQGLQINSNTPSLIMLLSLLPMSIIMVFSMKLSNKFGFEKVIKVCGIVYLISPLLFSLKPNIFTFAILCMLIPACAFSINSIPLLNLIWSYFPDHKHRITSVLISSFTLSSIIWNYVFMKYVNPDNIQATIQHQGQYYFDQKVTNNLLLTYNISVIISGVLFIIGSFLIKQNKKIQKQQIEMHQIASNQINQIANNQNSQTSFGNTPQFKCCTFLLTRNFIYLYMSTLFASLYYTFFSTNNKLIFITIMNNDHFLTLCYMGYSFIGLIGSFLWSYIVRIKGVRTTIFIYTIFDIGFKLIIFLLVNQKYSLILYHLGLGLCYKGMVTIGGLGLIELFGIKIGTELLPVKGTSLIITFVLVPLAQILATNVMKPVDFLKLLGILSIFSIIPSILLLKSDSRKRANSIKL